MKQFKALTWDFLAFFPEKSKGSETWTRWMGGCFFFVFVFFLILATTSSGIALYCSARIF